MKSKTPRDVQRTFNIAKDALNQFLSAMADYEAEGDKAVLVDRWLSLITGREHLPVR